MTNHRQATAAEIIADKQYYIERGLRLRFRHFVKEVHSARAWNGVRHLGHSSAKLRVINGVPFVMHHGQLQELTATAMLNDEGKTVTVYDVRINSEFLKSANLK